MLSLKQFFTGIQTVNKNVAFQALLDYLDPNSEFFLEVRYPIGHRTVKIRGTNLIVRKELNVSSFNLEDPEVFKKVVAYLEAPEEVSVKISLDGEYLVQIAISTLKEILKKYRSELDCYNTYSEIARVAQIYTTEYIDDFRWYITYDDPEPFDDMVEYYFSPSELGK